MHKKKKLFKWLVITLRVLLVLVVLGGIVTACVFFAKASLNWFFFTLFAVLIPVGVVVMKKWAIKDKVLTTEQEKFANGRLGLLIMFYWLVDIFYMCIFNSWLVGEYVVGGLILIIFIINLSGVFFTEKTNNVVYKFSYIIDFFIVVGLSVYLIFIIPNTEIKEILIPIVAALYGGLLTLIGVSWTIKASRLEKKEDMELENRPRVFIVNHETQSIPQNSREKKKLKIVNSQKQEGDINYKIEPFILYNGDYSYSSVFGVIINTKIYQFEIGQVLNKNTYTIIFPEGNLYSKEKPEKVYVLLQDMLDNLYKLEVTYEMKMNEINIKSGLEQTKLIL